MACEDWEEQQVMAHRWRLLGLALSAAFALSSVITAGAMAQGEPCKEADAKLTEESYEGARDAYAALLTQDEELACAQAGMDFVKVFALADLGLYAEARTQLAETIKEHPNAEVPEDLQYLVGGKILPWRSVKQLTDPWWLPAGELLALLVIVPLAWIALSSRVVPWLLGFRQYPLRLDVQAFDDGPTGLVLGKGLAVQLEEEIRRFGEREDINLISMTLVDTPIQSLAVPANIQSATPQLMVVSQLIEWALPQKVITLTGFLQKSGDRGAGLTLALAESWTGKIFANQTFWQRDYDPVPPVAPAPAPAAPAPPPPEAAPYHALTPRATAWVCWTLNDRQNSKD